MKMKTICQTGLIMSLIAILIGCEKFVRIEPPKNQLVSGEVFADSANADGAISGIYVTMIQPYGLDFATGGLTLYGGLSSDEFSQQTSDAEKNEFYTNNLSATNSYCYNLWISAYKLIYQVNACIEGITQSQGMDQAAKSRRIAEVRTIRAFCYFNLVNLFGGVPLIVKTSYDINRQASRSSLDAVYAFIEDDLKFATSNLPTSRFSKEKANYYAAQALLSKVFLFEGKYKEAIQSASLVITSGVFKLETDLDKVFQTTSRETIWDLKPVYPGVDTWEGLFFVPSSSSMIPNYPITDNLYNSFEEGDLRRSQWIGTNHIAGNVYHYPYKYKQITSGTDQQENYVLLRLSEQYLIRAEAAANLDDIPATIEDINVIRNRAGLSDLKIDSKSNLLLDIEAERRAELFCEGANRWYDLKRTHRATEVLAREKAGWKESAELFPIPQFEINADHNLTQNTGY